MDEAAGGPPVKEGLRALAEAPKRQPPELLTLKQKALLAEAALLEYEQRRSIWHATWGRSGRVN